MCVHGNAVLADLMALARVPTPKDNQEAFEAGKKMSSIPMEFITNLRRVHRSEVLQPQSAKQRLFHLLRGVRETHGGKFPSYLTPNVRESLDEQYSSLADACIPVTSQ